MIPPQSPGAREPIGFPLVNTIGLSFVPEAIIFAPRSIMSAPFSVTSLCTTHPASNVTVAPSITYT